MAIFWCAVAHSCCRVLIRLSGGLTWSSRPTSCPWDSLRTVLSRHITVLSAHLLGSKFPPMNHSCSFLTSLQLHSQSCACRCASCLFICGNAFVQHNDFFVCSMYWIVGDSAIIIGLLRASSGIRACCWSAVVAIITYSMATTEKNNQ